jgi:transposase
MSKRAWKLGNVKPLALAEGDQIVAGLDVHKKTVYAALRCNGQERVTWVMPMRPEAVVASLAPLKAALKKIVYEAGPTGYRLARALRKAGLPAEVVAPGKTPHPANRGSKTDRLDCRMLAEYAEKGLLKAITIPTEIEEADRQVVRLRDQLVVKLRRTKQQIKSLLLQQGIPEPAGLAHWTRDGIAALKQAQLSDQIRLALDVLVEDLEHLSALKHRVEAQLSGLMKQKRHREDSRRLRTHPGVGPLTAGTFVTEVYHPKRFARPEELTSYVGLAPRVRQSGETRREGPLVKAGRGALRALLIEASWTWIRHDAHAAAVYRRLVQNTGSAQKAIVAMARRMAVNLWCMLCRGEDYRAAA